MDTDIGALTVIFTEFYYWVTVPLDVSDPCWLLHVRGRRDRRKNHLHT